MLLFNTSGSIFDSNVFVRLGHKLRFQEETPSLAKDANTKDDEWFDIYDPRNALNKRRRQSSKLDKSKQPKLS